MNTAENDGTLISAQGVSVAYGSYIACHDVSFDIHKGDYLCIVGANGSGKTTIVKALLGLLPLKEGKVRHSGLETGYLPQASNIQRDFPASVREVVLSGCLTSRLFATKADRAMAEKQLEKLGLTEIAGKSYRDLSGGQQQRVLLARALCSAGNLIVLDEPVTGLDPVITDEFYATIRRLNHEDGLAVVMVSHDVHRAVQNATHILHMAKEPLFFGTADEYKQTDLYTEMSHVEVCETHLCTHCGGDCGASHMSEMEAEHIHAHSHEHEHEHHHEHAHHHENGGAQ